MPNGNIVKILSDAYFNKKRVVRYRAPKGTILEIAEIFAICTQTTGSPIAYILTRYVRNRFLSTAYNVNLPDEECIFKFYLAAGATLERVFPKPIRTKFLTIGLNSLSANCTVSFHINCSLEKMTEHERAYELARTFA